MNTKLAARNDWMVDTESTIGEPESREGSGAPVDSAWPRAVLIADPETSFRDNLARRFSEEGRLVEVASDFASATALIGRKQPDLVVLEIRLREGAWRGLDLMDEINQLPRRPRVVILTAYGSICTAIRAVRSGVDGYLTKPATSRQIIAAAQGGEPPALDPEIGPMSLDRAIWEYISAVYSQTGSMGRAARWLGIDRRSLRRMLAKYAP